MCQEHIYIILKIVQKSEDLRVILSTNIRAARKALHITQTQLSIYADISLSYMTDIERCKTWISDKTLIKIAKALNLSAYQLLRPEARDAEADAAPDTAFNAAEEREQAAGLRFQKNNAAWQAARDVKRQILKNLNESITAALTEYDGPVKDGES
jgi:transcriptional regulator with XRE-family HTH domain